jgi:LysR family glycine cleavage system transcriptional activator
MRKKLPPLTWFRAFESAARHLSFTAAARELGLTQSAISQQVRLLEDRFGVPLFIRLPRGLALTDTGRRVLPNITESINGLANVAAAFEPDQSKDTLTIAASISFAQSFIVPNLSDFLDDNPSVQVRIKSTLWPDDFMASDADVEIRFGSSESAGRGAEELYQDHIVMVCAPDMFDARPSWNDICNARRIQIVGTSETWEKWSNELNLDPPKNTAQLVDSHGLAIDLARCNAGVALTSFLLAAPALAAGTLIMPLKDRIIATDRYFISVKAQQENSFAQIFSHWLYSQVIAMLENDILHIE